MQTDVMVKFQNGVEKRGNLARELHTESAHVELSWHKEGLPEVCNLQEIVFIKFLGKPDLAKAFRPDEICEEITTVTGDGFRLRLDAGNSLGSGILGYPIDPACDFQSIFISGSALSQRRRYRPLGEVLTEQEGIAPEAIAAALSEKQRLLEKRVGSILVEQHNLPREQVERTIRAAQKLPSCGRVGEILVEAGLVTRQQVDAALVLQTSGKHKRIGTILVELGLISEEQLISALAHKFGLQEVDLDLVSPHRDALGLISYDMMMKMQVLPLEIRNNRLVVATANPTDFETVESLRFAVNRPIHLVVAKPRQIAAQLARVATSTALGVETLMDDFDTTDVTVEAEPEQDNLNETDSKVINLVNKVLLDAHRRGVSDIHFEPGTGNLPLKIRYRKDGICTLVYQVAPMFKAAVLSRLKIVAKLDIAERRRPQSGKILIKHHRERIEYRVEITPTIGGQEDAVLRVLSAAQILPLEQIGFSPKNLERMRHVLKKPYGLILCVGPTGSGKTTTLHSCIAELNTPARKIWTAEDPVEITQEGLRQVQVHPKIGFTFEEALRSFLRADPDVIMIGEMRDPVTAKTAIGASLTGHLVLSTLHTNSAAETVVRLIEMGMDPFNFADALLTVVAQRLTRRLCTRCAESYHPDRSEYEELVEAYGPDQFHKDGMPPYGVGLVLRRAKGCQACDGLGYAGRIAIHEQLVNSMQIKELVKHGSRVEKIQQTAIAEGMSTLRMDGIQKVFLGLTDFGQINRVVV